MNKKMIIDAYVKIRTIDQTIPDDVLDFMKDAAIEKLEQKNEIIPIDYRIEFNRIRFKKTKKINGKSKAEILNMRLQDCYDYMSRGLINSLLRAVYSIDELLDFPSKNNSTDLKGFKKIRGIGYVRLDELEYFLEMNDLKLKKLKN